jgi:DhnA family fructose-bisphosphate aldolase class Ia
LTIVHKWTIIINNCAIFNAEVTILSELGKKIRLNRILRGQGQKGLVVAFDHGLVLGPIRGTVDPASQLRRFASAGVDGILMNFGILPLCVDALMQDNAPALILRLDWSSIWTSPEVNGRLISELLARPEDALRIGADAVITYLLIGTGDAEFEAREISRNADIARECERVGIPLIVESLARGRLVENPRVPAWMNLHTRIAAELGADVIKTEYTGDVQSMREVVRICPIPILVLGGAKQESDEGALDVVRGATEAGAAGVCFGRNIFQASRMEEFLRLARSILNGTESAAAPAGMPTTG